MFALRIYQIDVGWGFVPDPTGAFTLQRSHRLSCWFQGGRFRGGSSRGTWGTCTLQTHEQPAEVVGSVGTRPDPNSGWSYFTAPPRRSQNHLVGWGTGEPPPQTFPPRRLRRLKSNVPLLKQFSGSAPGPLRDRRGMNGGKTT